MASCYGGKPGDGLFGHDKIGYLPLEFKLKDGTPVVVDWFTQDVIEGKDGAREMMNEVIREDLSWPFEEEFPTEETYRGYYLSHSAFCVRERDGGRRLLGTFYVKPNFPGRCSHFANGGFITKIEHRRRGVGRIMGRAFVRIARDLGYRAAYFNLVFSNNPGSHALWRSLGFRALAVVPKVAIVRKPHVPAGEAEPYYVDATQYFIDLTTLPASGKAPEKSKVVLALEDAWNAWSSAAPYALAVALPLTAMGIALARRND